MSMFVDQARIHIEAGRGGDTHTVADEYMVTQDPEIAVVVRDVPDESEGVIKR